MIGDIVDLLYDWSQNRKISQLHQEVTQLKQSARTSTDTDPVRRELEELRAANGELRLYVATLFRVLLLKGIIDRDSLARLVGAIDEEDGQRDNSYEGNVLP